MLRRLNNLEYINVSGCKSFRTLFPPCVTGDLTHLKELRVNDCVEVREIIEAGEQLITDGILFPELTVLHLSELPGLTSFGFYQSGKANTNKVALNLPKLSSIYLSGLPHLKSFSHGAYFEFDMPALKKVEVYSCGLTTLFSRFSIFRNFILEILDVRCCELLENVVEDLRGDETSNKIIKLSQLTNVLLENLPNLKNIFHNANYEFNMPVLKKLIVLDCGVSNTLFTNSAFINLKNLKTLTICDCQLVEGIFEEGGGGTLDTSAKIIKLNRVPRVHLEGLPKLRSIFYGATYECYMPALKNAKIFGCGIYILFTCSVFREIQQLKILELFHCESLERIVEELGGEETSEMNGKSVRKLKI